MTTRRYLEVEELGSRIMPSVSPGLLPTAFSAESHFGSQQHQHHHDLAGQGNGTYLGNSLVVDAGAFYTLNGTATLVKMGDVTVAGSLQGLGLIASGHATGTLTFTNKNGSVTLDLKGPQQNGFAPLPGDWKYQVIAATGGYEKLKGEHGSLQLTFTAELVPGPADGIFPRPQGTFKLAIEGGAHAKLKSGIDGVALVGPTSPVGRPGVPDTRPLAGAVILVETPDGQVVEQVVADANGRFHANVGPGTYRLVPLPPHPGDRLPRGTPQTVVVKAGDDTDVTLDYDSGIR